LYQSLSPRVFERMATTAYARAHASRASSSANHSTTCVAPRRGAESEAKMAAAEAPSHFTVIVCDPFVEITKPAMV